MEVRIIRKTGGIKLTVSDTVIRIPMDFVQITSLNKICLEYYEFKIDVATCMLERLQ